MVLPDKIEVLEPNERPNPEVPFSERILTAEEKAKLDQEKKMAEMAMEKQLKDGTEQMQNMRIHGHAEGTPMTM